MNTNYTELAKIMDGIKANKKPSDAQLRKVWIEFFNADSYKGALGGPFDQYDFLQHLYHLGVSDDDEQRAIVTSLTKYLVTFINKETATNQAAVYKKPTRFEVIKDLRLNGSIIEAGSRVLLTTDPSLTTGKALMEPNEPIELHFSTVSVQVLAIGGNARPTRIPTLVAAEYLRPLDTHTTKQPKIRVKETKDTFQVGGIVIAKNTEAEPELIPQHVPEILVDADKLQAIAHCIKTAKPVLLIGETGTGKTTLIEFLAAKTNNAFLRLNLDGATTKDEFVGKWLVNDKGTYWIDGILTKAMKNGYWLLLDEVNAALPEITMALHSVLEPNGKLILADKDGELVTPHADFRVFGTCNPDSYAGTKEFNLAFLSRFDKVVYLDYLPQKMEAALLTSRTEVPSEVATTLTMIANHLRDAKQKNAIAYPCSTRDLLAAATYYQEATHNITEAVKYTIANKMQVEADRTLLNDLLLLYA